MPEVHLKLYPRGFLGAVLQNKMQRQKALAESNQGFSLRNLLVMRDQNDFHVPNGTVEEIYQSYMHDCASTASFEFRHKVLLCAFNAFGTDDFRLWFEMQYQNPSAGDLHGRFLVDTLHFLSTGQREMCLENWSRLLTLTASPDDIGPVPEYARNYFGQTQSNLSGRKVSTTDAIESWCRKPTGFQDLVGTLHILFGSTEA